MMDRDDRHPSPRSAGPQTRPAEMSGTGQPSQDRTSPDPASRTDSLHSPEQRRHAGGGGSAEMSDPRAEARPGDLRAQARLNELERGVTSARFRLAMTRWLYLPVMLLALVAMVVGLILGLGDAKSVFGGAVAIAGGASGFFLLAQRQRDDLMELTDERDALLLGSPDAPRRAPRRRLDLDEPADTARSLGPEEDPEIGP